MTLAPIVVFEMGKGVPGIDSSEWKGRQLSALDVQAMIQKFEASGRYEFVQLMVVGGGAFWVARDHGETPQ